MLNPRVCDYALLAHNFENIIEEEIAPPKKITIDLNYLRSKGRIPLTLKQNCAK